MSAATNPTPRDGRDRLQVDCDALRRELRALVIEYEAQLLGRRDER